MAVRCFEFAIHAHVQALCICPCLSAWQNVVYAAAPCPADPAAAPGTALPHNTVSGAQPRSTASGSRQAHGHAAAAAASAAEPTIKTAADEDQRGALHTVVQLTPAQRMAAAEVAWAQGSRASTGAAAEGRGGCSGAAVVAAADPRVMGARLSATGILSAAAVLPADAAAAADTAAAAAGTTVAPSSAFELSAGAASGNGRDNDDEATVTDSGRTDDDDAGADASAEDVAAQVCKGKSACISLRMQPV